MKLNGKKLILLAAAILVVCCGTMLLSALHPSRPTVLSSALGAIVTPLEQAAASAGEAISDFFGYFYRYDALEAENEALRKELAKFQKLENLFHEAINENEQLRKLTEIREKHTDFQCEVASVVSTVDLGIHSSFTINKGSLVRVIFFFPGIDLCGLLCGSFFCGFRCLHSFLYSLRLLLFFFSQLGFLLGFRSG